MKSIVLKQEERTLFALILKFDPEARKVFSQLKRMGATNLRLDHMYNRNAEGTYTRNPDPGAWNADLPRYGGICAIRFPDEWSIHG